MALIDSIDSKADAAFEHLRGFRRANQVFYSLSAVADHSLLWFLFIGIEALIPGRYRQARRAAVAMIAESLIVNLLIKSAFRRERPIDRDFPHPHALRFPLTSSFPSGHATSAFAAAQLIAGGSLLRAPLYALALAVALSRIHVKIHHASDVAGGIVIGSIYGWLVRRIVRA